MAGLVGASGDLTPLSYLASTLVGERDVTLDGEVMSAVRAHEILGLEPLSLRPKESLAIMNGTSMMTVRTRAAPKSKDEDLEPP